MSRSEAPQNTTDVQRLGQFLRAQYPCIGLVTHEEEYALDLVRKAAAQLKEDLWLWSVIDGIRDGEIAQSPAIKDTEHPAAALYYWTHRLEKPGICITLDLADHLEDKKVLRSLRELIQGFCRRGGALIMIDHSSNLPAVVASHSTAFEISLPDEKELEQILKATLRRANREKKIEVDITPGALRTVIRNLHGLTRRQAEQIITETVADDRRFDEQDINIVLARKRQAIQHGGLLEFVETPVDLSGIGGLRRLKSWLKKRQGSVSHEATSFGLKAPRGVLMLGVQGAGKSLCAKAIAAAWQRPLLRLDPGALYDRYVGESEKRLRDALGQAEAMAPVILWIDEIEKAFASAASQSTDGGLSRRMFGSLLTWMQEHEAAVFMVATANDIEALPPELLRKGRFDEIFFVDLPDEHTRKQIFGIHIQKRKRDPSQFDLDALAASAEGHSGAEIEQAVVSALHDAFAEGAELSTAGILAAVEESPPLSVTMAEKVDALRRWAQGRCVPAD